MPSPPDKPSILVVDDAPETLELIQRNLSANGYRVLTAPGALEAISLLEGESVDLVVTDLRMPRVSGLDLVQHVRENLGSTGVMVITGYPTIQSAVTAVKAGSEEYLTKPFTDDELLSAVARALDAVKARGSAQAAAARPVLTPGGMIGESRAMRRLAEAISKAASTRATVLISGESGAGKELTARAIHYDSARASAPFVAVNCGSIPESLLESELFGHVKGAFTGAVESRAGFFQTADRGSLFLDEISDTSLSMQSKLLRVLEDGSVYMVGSSRSRRVDVRILAATNKDLHGLVRNGLFREDLFFRVNVIAIRVPPLRERDDDVLILASHFAGKFAQEMGRPAPRFSDRALGVLRGYPWPGNVRELQNLMQRVVVMSEGEVIDVPDLPSAMRFAVTSGVNLDQTLADVEAMHIRQVLAHSGGNKTRAAERLGIDRKTLREKLKNLKAD